MIPAQGFLDRLLAVGLLIDTGVDGLYGRNRDFESVVDGLDRMATEAGSDLIAEVMRFPPGMSRTEFERSGYLDNFPQLAGTVHCFCGDEREHRALLHCLEAGEDWTGQQQASAVVLTPAACYPVYPIVARRGKLPAQGVTVDVASYCFRHEPSREPARMQMFRMREYVRIGTPEHVHAFHETWLQRGAAVMEVLALPHETGGADDRFLGHSAKLPAGSQHEPPLAFEMRVPINDDGPPTACLSFGSHGDRFARRWDLRDADGAFARTACFGFGLERLALALLRQHGLNPARWPARVVEALWPADSRA